MAGDRPPARRFLPDVLGAWLTARVLVLGVWIVVSIVDRSRRVERLDEGLLAWDGGWYELIARAGYSEGGEQIRFFPLFPLLGRLAGAPLGGRWGIGLVIVSNGFAVTALWLLALWTSRVTESDDAARRTVWALALWPAGFVLVFAYSEALFLTLAIGAAIAALDRRWWLAGLLAALASLTRPTGLALLVLLVGGLATAWRSAEARERTAGTLALAGPPLGVALFAWAASSWYGDWRGPFDVQELLRGDVVDPVSRLWDGLGDAAGPERFGDGLHLPFAVAAIVAVAVVWRVVGRVEGCFVGAIVLVAISAENWNSIERYTMNAFPIFAAAGVVGGRVAARWWYLTLAVSGAALAALTTLAWTGHYVP